MNNDEIRISSLLSPRFESEMIIPRISGDIVSTIIKARDFYYNFKNLLILFIPKEIIWVFYLDNSLRSFYEDVISDPQSNIMFTSTNKRPGCNLINICDVFHTYPQSTNINRQIINNIFHRHYPLLIDNEDIHVKKGECHSCDNIDNPCKNTYKIYPSKIPDEITPIRDFLSSVSENIELWFFKRSSIKPNELKALALLLGILYGVEDDKLSKISEYFIHESLCNDLINAHKESLCNIAFSMFRAFAFPSISSGHTTTPDRFSIDWHRHDPHDYNGYNLYRVDVMPHNSTGLTSSGVERLLMAKKGSDVFFIAYTPNHEFTNELIRTRISSMKS